MAGGYKSINRILRTWFKPGVRSFQSAAVETENYTAFPCYPRGQNADQMGDHFGNQWVRDANVPNPFTNNTDSNQNFVDGFLEVSQWRIFKNVSLCYPGENNAAKVTGIFQIVAQGGDPAVSWATTPIYLQIMRGRFSTGGGPPVSGVTLPDFVMPLPRPPEAGVFNPGIRAPFVGDGSGICVAISSTRDVYTTPGGGLTATFNVNYAHFTQTSSET